MLHKDRKRFSIPPGSTKFERAVQRLLEIREGTAGGDDRFVSLAELKNGEIPVKASKVVTDSVLTNELLIADNVLGVSPTTNEGLKITADEIKSFSATDGTLLHIVYAGDDAGDFAVGDYDGGNHGWEYDHSEGTLGLRANVTIANTTEVQTDLDVFRISTDTLADILGNLGDIDNGGGYAKVNASALNASGLAFLSATIDSEGNSATSDDLTEGATNFYAGVSGADFVKSIDTLADILGSLGDIADGGGYGKVESSQLTSNRLEFASIDGNLGDIADGGGYGKIEASQLTANRLEFLSIDGDLGDIDDGGGYQKVASSSLTASGLVVLSQTVDSGGNSATSDDLTEGSTNLYASESGADNTQNHATNLLDEGTFAAGGTGWNLGTGWSVTTNAPLVGSYNAEHDGADGQGYATNFYFPVVAGERYFGQCYAKATAGADGDCRVYVNFYGEMTNYIGGESILHTGSGDSLTTSYQAFRSVFSVPATAVKARVVMSRKNSPTTGTFYVDNIYVGLVPKDIDDVPDGSTRATISATYVTAGNLLLLSGGVDGDLDDIEDGDDHGKVDLVSINTGGGAASIVLSGCSGNTDDISAVGASNQWAAEEGAVKNFTSLTDSAGTFTIATGKMVVSASEAMEIDSATGLIVKSGGDIKVADGGEMIFYDGSGLSGKIYGEGIGGVESSLYIDATEHLRIYGGSGDFIIDSDAGSVLVDCTLCTSGTLETDSIEDYSGGDLSLSSASDVVITCAYGAGNEVKLQNGGSNKLEVLTTGTRIHSLIAPSPNNSVDCGHTSYAWADVISYGFTEKAAAKIGEDIDALSILKNSKVLKNEKGEAVKTTNDLPKLDFRTIPGWLTNKEKLYTELKAENGELYDRESFEQDWTDGEFTLWRTGRDIPHTMDTAIAAILQIDKRLEQLETRRSLE